MAGGDSATNAQKVDLKFALPGTVGLYQVNPDTVATDTAATISITETNTSPTLTLGQVEVVLSTARQEVQVRYKANVTGTEYAFLSVDVNVVPLLKVNATTEKAIVSVSNNLDIAYDDRVKITASSAGNIFISDKNLQVNTTYTTRFVTTASGGIQVELKDIWSRDGVLFQSSSYGNLTYVGALHSSLHAILDEGLLCFPSGPQYVEFSESTTADQVSYPGKGDAKFLCVAQPVPERRMTRLGPNRKPTDPDSPLNKQPVRRPDDGDTTDDMKGFGTMVALIMVGALVGCIAMIVGVCFILREMGCFARCRKQREHDVQTQYEKE